MSGKKFPKASEVITTLVALIAEHGDLTVCADDPDTDWRMEIGIVYTERHPLDWPPRFEIKTTYHGDPSGPVVSDAVTENKNATLKELGERLVYQVDAQGSGLDDAEAVHDWRNYIPAEIHGLWPSLTKSERLLVALTANLPADREEWD